MGFGSDLANIVVPARRSLILPFTLSTTARVYDMRSMLFGRLAAPDTAAINGDKVFLRLQAVTAVVFYYFAPDDTAALDRTAAISDGGAVAVATTYGDQIAAGSWVDVCIDRSVDKYLHVQGSAAGTLIVRASSMVG